MATRKSDTERKAITLSVATFRALEKLAESGYHGSEWTGVARRFVDEGVRKAIAEGYIDREEDTD